MFRSEKLFVRAFLAYLKFCNASVIPFGNQRFYDGIEKVHKYFIENQEQFGEKVNEISLLFLKRPIEGNFDEFQNVFLNMNGSVISLALKNPYYENAEITIDDETIEYFLNTPDFDINKECIKKCVEAFCEGAAVSCNSKIYA